MDCPVCKNVKLAIADRQGIEIDYCPNCRGVWLDRGELDKLIERSQSLGASGYSAAPRPPAPPPSAPSQGHYEQQHHGDYYKKKKREGFLSDLFDFD